MEEDSETAAAGGHVSAAVLVGLTESASPTLPAATDINTDIADTSAAISASSETQEPQH